MSIPDRSAVSNHESSADPVDSTVNKVLLRSAIQPVARTIASPQDFPVENGVETIADGMTAACIISEDKDATAPKQSAKAKKSDRSRKVRSINAVSQHCKFGPKGFLMDCSGAFIKIPDPSSQKLSWLETPLSVLVIKKPYDETVASAFRDMVVWLVEEKSLLVFVEESVAKDSQLSNDPQFHSIVDKLQKFTEGVDDLENKVDFIVCLGGDGTLLYASSLFQQSVPPVIAFNMGSLGFLTPFPFSHFKEKITHVINGEVPLLLRYRLKCVILNHSKHRDGSVLPIPHVKLLDKNSYNISHHIMVLNEVVIDRGSSSYLCHLDLYIEGHLVTSVLGDGLIMSTPTGSTAYSVAAGASMIHPNVPCILITPICPHSLSFRPIVVPAGVEIKVTLAPEARGVAMVSFDGRNRQEIHQGVSLRITTASYPVPSICAHDQIRDWFNGLADCLHWNVRKAQKALSSCPSLTSLDSIDLEYNSNREDKDKVPH